MIKVVLDTNIFISGIFWEGNFCAKIIDLWREGKIVLVSSIELIKELVKTLRDFKIQMDENMIKSWKELIIKNSIMVELTEKISVIKEDSGDNKFLEAAIAGEVEYIVSQDRHLLNLKEFREIKIVKPEEFLGLTISIKNKR